jgi:lipid-A-disaccharide synthase
MPLILLSAGDPSGDAHAARLIDELRAQDSSLQFAGLGGPAMQAAGMELLDNLTAAAAIGPFDAAGHLPLLLRARKRFKRFLAERKPDLTVLVDFGDFHLPFLAPLASARGAKVVQYISPQIWAWGRFRLRWVRAHISRMLVLFPFEEAFYVQEGIPATWVGHPLAEQASPALDANTARNQWGLNAGRMTVGLLPGSRASEVRRHLPLMLQAAGRIADAMPGVQFLIPAASGLAPELFEPALRSSHLAICLAQGPLADCLQLLDAAIVCSGTATLQTALAGVPMGVVYRTSWPTYLAARLVLRIPNIALVNVVAGRAVVPEFVQRQAQPQPIAEAIVGLLRDASARQQMVDALRQVKAALGGPGAVQRAAKAVLGELRR